MYTYLKLNSEFVGFSHYLSIEKLFSNECPYWTDIFWEYQDHEIIKELNAEYPYFQSLRNEISGIYQKYPRLVKITDDHVWNETESLTSNGIKSIIKIFSIKQEISYIYAKMMFVYGCRYSMDYMKLMKKKESD